MAKSSLARSVPHPAIPAAASRADALHALCAAACASHGAGRIAEAITRYRQILAVAPDLPLMRNNLGHALATLGQLDAAVAEYGRAVALKPDYAEALCNWGVALCGLDRSDEAEAKFRRAIAVAPAFAGAYHNLAALLKERGRLAEAVVAAEHAIRLAPRNPAYYEHLGALRPFAPGDPAIDALEALQADDSLHAAERAHLHFALAKAYQDIGHQEPGRFDDAFAQLVAGNALKRQATAYDEAATLGRMARTRALFTADFVARRQGGDPSPLPVFIVGMPRSGTTLIEQILASHPRVHGAGELSLLGETVAASGHALPGAPAYPEMAATLTAEGLRAFGAAYAGALAQRAPGAARIVDKMPDNFLYAGLIHLALPNAVIVHAVRDPLDTCVSCFAMLFTGEPHTYDLGELGRYYRHYRDLMAHWHRVLPQGRILDVRYEDLVADVEGVARRIVAHCGLDWDPRCLDFPNAARSVRTASAAQVRQPIYLSAIGRWRVYEKHLGALRAEIES